jgi:hypothetical protein
MGKVLFSISEELFIDVMNMPENTKIQFIGLKKEYNYTIIDILAVHDDIPGKNIHEVTPVVSVNGYCDQCIKPLELEWDWNIPEENDNDI